MNEMESELPAIDEMDPSSAYTTNDSGATSKVSKRRSLADIASEFERTVEVQDRRYRLKVYKNAFIGRDACVTLHRILLGEDSNFTQHQALLLGRYINKKYGLFEHVTRDHDTLEDDYLFYRFTKIRKVPPPDKDGHDEAFLEKLLSGEESESSGSDGGFDEFEALAFLAESSLDDSSNYLSVGSVRSLSPKRDGFNTRGHSTKGIPKGISRRAGFRISKGKSPDRSLGALSHIRPFSKHRSKKEERSSLFDIKDCDLHEAAKAFEIGVEVKTNRYRGKAFKGTFVGADAVDVLIATRFATSRTMAEKIGQALARQFNLFEHVTQEHGKRKLHEEDRGRCFVEGPTNNCLHFFLNYRVQRRLSILPLYRAQ